MNKFFEECGVDLSVPPVDWVDDDFTSLKGKGEQLFRLRSSKPGRVDPRLALAAAAGLIPAADPPVGLATYGVPKRDIPNAIRNEATGSGSTRPPTHENSQIEEPTSAKTNKSALAS